MRTTSIPVRDASAAICAGECGAQCCRAPGHFSLQHHELVRIGEYLDAHDMHQLGDAFQVFPDPLNAGWYEADHRRNGGKCTFLDDDTNLCRVYEVRPEACRNYPERPEPRCILWEP